MSAEAACLDVSFFAEEDGLGDSHTAHDDATTAAFNWDLIYSPEERLSVEEFKGLARDYALVVLQRLFGFIFPAERSSRMHLAGVGLRAAAVAWLCLPKLHALSQVQMASLVGCKNKQSFGRWVTQLRDFLNGADGDFICRGMQSEQARASCRAREARKLEVRFQEEGASDLQVSIDFQI